MGTARAPVFGSGRCPACNCRVSNPKSWACSASVTTSSLAAQEPADDGRLARLLEQEAVVAVRRLDHVELYRLSRAAQRLLDRAGAGRRVEPVGAERDEQRPRSHRVEGPRERPVAVLPGEVEVG